MISRDRAHRHQSGHLAGLAFCYGLFIGLGATALLFGFSWLLETRASWADLGFMPDPADWLIVAMVLNVALSALVQWYLEKRAFGVHYRQFRRMLVIYLLAYQKLGAILEKKILAKEDVERAKELLKRLGRESLAEHADWLLVHRDRPIELPKLEL